MSESRPVIVYDGECRFCLWSVGRIRRFDRNGCFEYLPRQTDGIEERFPVLSHSDFNTGLRLIHAGGQVDVGADAVYQIYRRLPPWHLFAGVYRIPGLKQLFRAGYGLVARNRHRFGRVECTDEVCEVSYGERHNVRAVREPPLHSGLRGNDDGEGASGRR